MTFKRHATSYQSQTLLRIPLWTLNNRFCQKRQGEPFYYISKGPIKGGLVLVHGKETNWLEDSFHGTELPMNRTQLISRGLGDDFHWAKCFPNPVSNRAFRRLFIWGIQPEGLWIEWFPFLVLLIEFAPGKKGVEKPAVCCSRPSYEEVLPIMPLCKIEEKKQIQFPSLSSVFKLLEEKVAPLFPPYSNWWPQRMIKAAARPGA